MDLVDSKFIGLVSSRLQKFKRVKPDLYNFRCPICGDSQKQKNKARGYIYGIKQNVNFRCHNCGASMSLNNFLKELDPVIQKQYAFEKFKDGHTGRNFVVEEPTFKFEEPKFKQKLDLPKASENPIAKQYLERRKLDPNKFYYTDKFKACTNTLKETFDDVKYDEARIIIPLFYKDNLVGFQGRSLGPNKVKYITVMINDEHQKSTDWIPSEKMLQSSLQKDQLIAHSYAFRLLCVVQTVMLGSGVLALLFGFMITNQGLKKLRQESPTQLPEVSLSSSGQIK